MVDSKPKPNYVPGMWINPPNEGAPDFVKFTLGIQSSVLVEWMRAQDHNEKGYLEQKIEVLESKDGTKLYAKLSTYKPKDRAPEPEPEREPEPDQNKMPF